MTQSSEITGPECSKCEQPMLWQSMQLVGAQPMNVFHCESCDKFTAAAAMPASNSGNSKIQNEAQP